MSESLGTIRPSDMPSSNDTAGSITWMVPAPPPSTRLHRVRGVHRVGKCAEHIEAGGSGGAEHAAHHGHAPVWAGGSRLGRVGKWAANAWHVLRQGFRFMEECEQHTQQQRRVRAAQR